MQSIKCSNDKVRKVEGGSIVWIGKRDFENLSRRVDACEKELEAQKEQTKEFVIGITKKILRQPKKLSKELKSDEQIERFVNKLIHSQ